MNTQKGYNGRLRKARRLLDQMKRLWESGDETFETLWTLHEPILALSWDVPKGHPIHAIREQAQDMVDGTAMREIEEEQLAEYWESVL